MANNNDECEQARKAVLGVCGVEGYSTSPPDFETILSVAEGLGPQEELSVGVYSPYADKSFIESFRLEGYDDERIIGDPDDHRVFELPGGKAGHFNTEFGTDRMPNLVVAVDTS
jgi:hypothetical protein